VDQELLSALNRLADVVAVEEVGDEPDTEHRAPVAGERVCATVTLAVTEMDIAPLVAETVMRRGYQLFGLVPVHRSLEEIFMDLVEGVER
jgi:hypothetical protein